MRTGGIRCRCRGSLPTESMPEKSFFSRKGTEAQRGRGSEMRLSLLIVFVLCNCALSDEWRTIPLIEDGRVAAGWQHVGWGKMVVEGDVVRTEPEEKGLGV